MLYRGETAIRKQFVTRSNIFSIVVVDVYALINNLRGINNQSVNMDTVKHTDPSIPFEF